jgi:hypothetical protein
MSALHAEARRNCLGGSDSLHPLLPHPASLLCGRGSRSLSHADLRTSFLPAPFLPLSLPVLFDHLQTAETERAEKSGLQSTPGWQSQQLLLLLPVLLALLQHPPPPPLPSTLLLPRASLPL